MTRQGWDVRFTAYAACDWRANLFPVGIAHSIVGVAAREPTPVRVLSGAVRRSRPCAHALVSSFYFLLGSSAGLTYVDTHGPVPWIWIVASSFAIAKCGVFGGITMKPPAGSAFIPPASTFSPLPM
jgi:hypothetical protein